MLDLDKQSLSEAIAALGKEINRGVWELNKEVECRMVRQVEVTATVSAHPDRLTVESIAVSETGKSVTNQEQSDSRNGVSTSIKTGAQNGTSSRSSNSSSMTNGGNTDTQIYSYESDN